VRKYSWVMALIASVCIVIALTNSYPFFCGEPWSPAILVPSRSVLALALWVVIASFLVLDVALFLTAILFLWSKGFKPRFSLWATVFIASLLVFDALCAVFIDYGVFVGYKRAEEFLRRAFYIAVAIGIASLVYDQYLTPLVAPIAVASYFVHPRNLFSSFRKRAWMIVLSCLAYLAVYDVLTMMAAGIVDKALTRANPLALFPYFRCVSRDVLGNATIAIERGIGLAPIFVTWGLLLRFVINSLALCGTSLWLVKRVAHGES